MGNSVRYTSKAVRAISLASTEAAAANKRYIGSEHLLLGLLAEGSGGAYQFLTRHGLRLDDAQRLSKELSGETDEGGGESEMTYTPVAKRILQKAEELSAQMRHPYVGTEHILLSMLKENSGISLMIMRSRGVDTIRLAEELLTVLKKADTVSDEQDDDSDEYEALTKYTRNLNDEAREGRIDPIIGREFEIERLIQILARRTKNNPVLIGDPGVGKTAIVEGLALKIVEGDIPDIMKNIEILSLDLAGMLAGSKYRGDFEERIKNVIDTVIENPNLVLFIDELHTIIGAGASEGSLDASNIIKPMLAKGRLRMIGATTIDEYRKRIEKDSAFERRLSVINVDEPSVEDTINIIRGIADKYEAHHGVKIEDDAIISAVELSHRYINDRYLPDKAIDLIDEACSKKHVAVYKNDDDLKNLEESIALCESEKEAAISAQNYELAATLRDKQSTLKQQLAVKSEEFDNYKENVNAKIDAEMIRAIVSQWTGVPVTTMTSDDREKLINLDSVLKSEVIGQDEAVDKISRAIKRARVGLKNPQKPIGSFIFVGPTGVGKTYLAKMLAKELFGNESSFIRVDMSEYMEKHAVSKLIGSPPGYVGFEEGGQLTDKVRTTPYSVVLFDEIEKAHPDVFNSLLQILDDGRLTDGQGRTVDFKNTVIIMTSNAGASLIANKSSLGFAARQDKGKADYDSMKSIIEEEIKRIFRPEFLNRLDDVIVFRSLEMPEILKIVELMSARLCARLKEMDIEVRLTDSVKQHIAEKGFDKSFGARPLERAITHMLEDELADEILSGRINKNEKIVIDYVDGDVRFSHVGEDVHEEKLVYV